MTYAIDSIELEDPSTIGTVVYTTREPFETVGSTSTRLFNVSWQEGDPETGVREGWCSDTEDLVEPPIPDDVIEAIDVWVNQRWDHR